MPLLIAFIVLLSTYVYSNKKIKDSSKGGLTVFIVVLAVIVCVSEFLS